MIVELGHFALILALCVALVQMAVPLLGASLGRGTWMEFGHTAARVQLLAIGVAYLALTYAFVTNDFSVKYVASHSNLALPLQYRIAGVWGGHEGSMLLWALMLSGWTVLVTYFSRSLPREIPARVIAVMGFVSVGIIAFIVFTSSPFERLLPSPLDGRDLNPMLQDPGLILHPPLLYMGYVGFAVTFGFAIAALIGGRLDQTWARWSRPWTTAAWVFLTLGIALGSWWAYYELGWGGWWFWDPVENASLMPWLTGTALIHSLAVTEKRGTFRNWTVLLAIITFALTILAAFLVRSGVLTSVHAFATDPDRGVFILSFLTVVVGISLLLYAWRAPAVGLGGGFALVSRESMMLANNVLLTVAMATVLLGTLYPLVLDAFGLGKISVGPPYFEAVLVPLTLPLLLLLALAPFARWKHAVLPDVLRRQYWGAAVAAIAAIAVPLAMGRWSLLVALGVFAAVWVITSVVEDLRGRLFAAGSRDGLGARVRRVPRSIYGMHAAHLGVGLFIVGATLVSAYDTELDVRMSVGEEVTVAGYTFRFDSTRTVQGPNFVAERGTFTVTRDGREIVTLKPEKRDYPSQQMPMTQASLNRGVLRDLYVSLGDPVARNTWIVRVYYKPFMNWVWVGCVLMAFGGLLAASDRRYRLKRKAERTIGAGPHSAAPIAERPT
jgi:cytochrome c-type biogenesis protein CcmF